MGSESNAEFAQAAGSSALQDDVPGPDWRRSEEGILLSRMRALRFGGHPFGGCQVKGKHLSK